jgi:type IV pilus assembly protein PilN
MQINLLPWREQAREIEQQKFLAIFGSVIGVFLLITLVIHILIKNHIHHQNQSLAFLQTEISQGQTELSTLQKQKEELATVNNQLNFLKKLRNNSFQVVGLLNELVKTVPSAVSLTQVSYRKDHIMIEGIAQSDWQVTSFIRNISQSKTLAEPELIGISKQAGQGDDLKHFKLKVVYRD